MMGEIMMIMIDELDQLLLKVNPWWYEWLLSQDQYIIKRIPDDISEIFQLFQCCVTSGDMMDCIDSVSVSKSQKMTFYVDLSASQDIKVCSVTDDSIVAQINCARKISFRNNMWRINICFVLDRVIAKFNENLIKHLD